MQLKFLAIIALGVAAFAEEQALTSLKQIKQTAVDFEKQIAEFNGGYFGAASLAIKSLGIVNMVNAAASHPEGPKARSANAAMDIEFFNAAWDLENQVGSVIDTTIGAKSKIEAIEDVGKPAALIIIKQLHQAASNLSSQMSSELQGKARTIVNQIDDHFKRANAAFEA